MDAKPTIDLSTYTCNQFLSDAAKPDSADKLLRSMMLISWATGYAAAHQTGTLRADPAALMLIGNALGGACRKAPNKFVVQVTEMTIEQFLKQ